VLLDVWDVEVGEGGTMGDVTGEATSLSRIPLGGMAIEVKYDEGMKKVEAECECINSGSGDDRLRGEKGGGASSRRGGASLNNAAYAAVA
jgi:hypothetical protein